MTRLRPPSALFGLACWLVPLVAPHGAHAQVRPHLTWYTLTTEHFRVHFTAELEPLARRSAATAERAYAELARDLVPPRGTIDLVVADNMDFANGYATPYPSNRIVIYARPPVEDMALRNHGDWNRTLITHELTHIFHLDRVRGIWDVAQTVFGRAAPLFPNTYLPSWMIEGLAVHYETRLAPGGRLAGTEFPMYVRAAALAGHLPSLDALSLATPTFPGGTQAYLYGAYALTRPDGGDLRELVESTSGQLIPFRPDAAARSAFGTTFSAAWDRWRDSVTREVAALPPDTSGAGSFRTLTTHGFTARFPRFVADDRLVYVANDARAVTGLYSLGLDGAVRRERVGRRASVDVNVPVPALGTVQGELEYTDPYSVQSDLFRASGWRRRRLTAYARLSSPDVQPASRRLVAVRTDPGTTSLVLVDPGAEWDPRVLVAGTLDRTWAEPRFSRDGQRVAAVRWERGGRSAVVVMDLQGRPVRSFAPRAPYVSVVSSPVFEPGDSTLLFVSDHEGRAMVYRGDIRSGAYGRVWSSATGLNTPDVSPGGRWLAAVELRADGYHVVMRETPGAVPLALPASDTLGDPLEPLEAPAIDDETREGRYNGLRHLVPTWWLPAVITTDPGTMAYGFTTGASDPVRRHVLAAEVTLEPNREEWSGHGRYEYAGMGVPVVVADVEQRWVHGPIRTTGGAFAGWLGQRSQAASLALFYERPRVRHTEYLLAGTEFEEFSYRSYPPALLPNLGNAALLESRWTRAYSVLVGLSTLQMPTNGVSPSDGVTASFSYRARYGTGVHFEDVGEWIGALVAAKSLPFPGFSRHVVAVRGAYGLTGHASTAALDAGGVSGSSLELVPGIVIGGSRRTFGVRGFNGGTLLGVRAAGGSVEYRAPLTLVGRGLGLWPLFLQKAVVTGFADAATAWCERDVADSFICPNPLPPRTTLASVGAELGLDASLQYDRVYRFRLGLAHPVRGVALAPRANTLYFALGSTF